MMRVRFRYTSWLAFVLKVGAITLYPFVFVRYAKNQLPPFLVEHEYMHVRQVRALGWWRFYLTYIGQYLRTFFKTFSGDDAYMSVSYEKEAYDQQDKTPLTDEERAEWSKS